MKISIVIPAFNEAKLLGATLRCVKAAGAAFSDLGWTMDIVVCDNNSTDDTAALAVAEGARVVFEKVNQIGRARNTGAAAADGDWLIFVDADSRPTRELFADVAGAIQSGRCLAGGSTVRMDLRNRAGDFATGLWNRISRTMKWMAGAFIFCERSAFNRIGGFNLELFASEEIDLSKRLKRLARQEGKKIVILHRHPLETSARKLSLYSARDYFRVMLKAMFNPRKALRSPEDCHPWYDGRR